MGAGPGLLVDEVVDALVSSNGTLLMDGDLDALGAVLFLSLILLPLAPVLSFFLVCCRSIILDLMTVLSKTAIDGLFFLLFYLLVALCFKCLLGETLLFSHLPLLVDVDVAAALVQDVVCALPGLIDLAHGLAFLLLEQANAIAQQLEVFLSPLASHLRSDQLLVKSRIVVLLIGSEVHLFVALSGLVLTGGGRLAILLLLSFGLGRHFELM